MPEGVDTAVLGSGTKTVLEPESAPFQSFQSFFSPQQSTHVGFEQMSMDNHPLSSTTGNIQSTVNDSRANLLISPRPRYTTRSFRGPNSEALSMGAIIDANHSASSLNRGIGSPDNNPSALGTISSIVNRTPEANSEEMEKERLDYQIKGRSHVSIGYSGGLDSDRWTTTTAKGNQHSLGMESIPDDRSSRVTGRHSISKPKMSTSPAATNSSAAISGSSEMLPLSEFLSQTADSDKPDTPSTEGLSRRTDDTELNYPMSPYLWHRLSPAAPVVQAYVFIVAFSSMLKTSWTDPGVIPRGIDGDPPVDPPIERDPSTASYYPPQGQPRLKEVQIGVYTVRLKY
ncbi:Eukaryotic peptide chain release factor GTP-binding subunit, partial [Entomortierella chlamydospora]